MNKTLRGLMLTLVVLALALGVPLQAQQHKPIRPNWPTQPKDKLHEMAKNAGGRYVFRYKPNRSTLYPNLEEMAKRSDLVIVGRTLSHRSKLRQDGNFITQDFLVRVQEVVKGDLKDGKSIVITLAGGAYIFPDGMSVIMRPMDLQETEDRGTYVFFLSSPKKGSLAKTNQLVSETQGMFALSNGRVEPANLAKDDPVVNKYQQMDAADFLKQIHRAIPRKERTPEGAGIANVRQ